MMDELRRKYEIAMEALWHYGKPSNWHMCDGGDERHRHYGFGADEPERLEGFEVARKALNEIWKIEENTKPKISSPRPNPTGSTIGVTVCNQV